MEESSRRTKDRKFIIEIRDRSINIIILLYVKMKNKSSAFDIRGSSGKKRRFFCLSPKVGWLSLDQNLLGL